MDRKNWRYRAGGRRPAGRLDPHDCTEHAGGLIAPARTIQGLRRSYLIPDRLGLYSMSSAPNGSQNEEAYVRYGNPAGFYLGGSFICPLAGACRTKRHRCGLTGIAQSTPDKGKLAENHRGRRSWISPMAPPIPAAAPAIKSPGRWCTSAPFGDWVSRPRSSRQKPAIGGWVAYSRGLRQGPILLAGRVGPGAR